jgi:uncharacterized membrane protein YhaH (DUF805 family)
MSFTQVLFNPNGRITQGQFWAGWAVIFGGNLIANFIPILGLLVSIGLIYVGCCVYGKRLHDMGRSAWLHAIPWAVGLVLGIAGMVVAFPQLMEMAQNDPEAMEDPMAMMSALGPVMMLGGLSMLVWLGYTIWVGTGRPDPETNRFGPPPGMQGAQATFS